MKAIFDISAILFFSLLSFVLIHLILYEFSVAYQMLVKQELWDYGLADFKPEKKIIKTILGKNIR